ncbi:MAG: helix-turn-helix domain-containing protein [Pseudolysinimonas sp.]
MDAHPPPTDREQLGILHVLTAMNAKKEAPHPAPLRTKAHFVSRRFLDELFEPLNETPAEHLRRLRLRRAVELLADPRPSIAQVAERSGFADPTTFTRAFHREFGMLPREFRHG